MIILYGSTFREILTEIDRLRDDFEAIRQTGSTQAYIGKFQALILELPEKTEDDLVHKFLNGLKPRIQIFTRPHHPKTLDEAMTIADDIEASHYNTN